MAEKIKNFGGFRLINGSAAGFNLSGLTDKTVIYFVRTSADNGEDGFIYFNGKKYGTGKLSSDKIQTQLTELKKTVDDHTKNKATVTVTARTGTTDNGALSGDTEEKWLTGTAIEKIKTYVDSEDVKSMVLTEDNKIQLQNKSNVVLAELDVTSFIKDGMLESVTLVDDKTKGKVLQFTWNTESGKESTPIEVSEFFHEISGDTKTIDVTQPASGTTGSLKISAKTVASVSDVTSGATALMTGGITQQYVAQEINTLKTGLDSTLALSATTGSVTYATANIVQTDGKLSKTGSNLVLNVATGLTEKHAGFVYNTTGNTFTANETPFAKTGLLDAQEVIALLRNNNTNVANALSYLKSQITTLSGEMTTVTGSDYITVTNATGTNKYTVSASDTLQTVINKANSAVQSVNGQKGTDITLNTDNIKASENISGYTSLSTDTNVTNVLNNLYNKLSQTSSNALTSVSGSTSINVTEKSNGSQTISVKAKPLNETEKAVGQIEIKTDANGIYGLLYFGGDDVEQ